jgi:ATP-dependent DNA helicase RecG
VGLINIGEETEHIEYKKSTGELKEGVISVASILNKHGEGMLYFGVKNNGDVIGQIINDQTLRTVSQAIGNHIKPRIYPTIFRKSYDGREVVVVEFKGANKPYLAYNIPRIRVADEDLVMDQETYDAMIRDRDDSTKSWERRVSKYHIEDINMEVFSRYLKRAREVGRISFDSDDAASVLSKLELTEGDMLLNAGAALFVDSGINDLQMAKFATNEKGNFTDIRRHSGSILSLIDVAMQYLIDAMDWRVEFSGKVQRDEIPEVPVDALREAVVNAFAHRQIESGQSIQIMIFRNRIEIYSPGVFPERITPEEFAEGDKKAIRRNKLITQTLYYSKDMETFATGLKKIKNLCNEVGVKYEFRMEEYGFTVVFFRHCGEGWGWSGDAKDTAQDNVPHNVPRNVPRDSNREERIRAIIEQSIRENNKVTRAVMAERAGVSEKTISRKIKDMDHITFIGKGDNGYWEIKEQGD